MDLDQRVQNIAKDLRPVSEKPSVKWRWGTVLSVDGSGTMNVQVGDEPLLGIRASRHCMSAKVGDRVRVSYYGTEALVDAIRATEAQTGESAVGEWGTWKWSIVGNLAVCEYENTDTRSIEATTQWGGLYYANLGSLPFPFEFATPPQVSGSIAESSNDFWLSFRGVSTTQIGGVSALRVGSATVNGKLCVTAIGRI